MEYQDRGMLKYQGFILSEHHDALERNVEKQTNIRQRLTNAFKNQQVVQIQYGMNKEYARIREIDYIMEKVVIMDEDNIEKIISIEEIETLVYKEEI
ncbi:hypothetical protein [Listeria grayi]|uniref:YolD-like protein n=1 Tax=Listeria grayi DSM 20601 TaxID=525367 RepID=D7UUG5_LISGR|nr:hypothetical protein [Listeria grayi]EFI85272.1 hypothetical protein HMPREF0556_10471 [Listeria grayi DSM 20601]